jgi:hypothetical protein
MMAIEITEKGNDLIRTKVINGDLYAYCMTREDGKEIWLKVDTGQPSCELCGYEGPLQQHHVHGRKNSNETIVICANCHAEIHAGLRHI